MGKGRRANKRLALSDDDDDSDDDTLSFNFLAPGASTSSQDLTPEQRPGVRRERVYEPSPLVRSVKPRALLPTPTRRKRASSPEPSSRRASNTKAVAKKPARGTKRKKTNDDDDDADDDDEGGPKRGKGSKARLESWEKFKKAERGMDWKSDRDLGTTVDPDADPMLRPQDALVMKNLSYEQLVWARLPFGGRNAYWPARTHVAMESIGTKDKTELMKNGWNTRQPDQTVVTYLYSGERWLVACVKDEHIKPLDPDDNGAKWRQPARDTRKVFNNNRTHKNFKSFTGSLDGAMGLARKYHIKLKRAADKEAAALALLSDEDDDDEDVDIDIDAAAGANEDDEVYNPYNLKPEKLRAGDKIMYVDITMPSHMRNQTDVVVKVLGDGERYPIQLERGSLLEPGAMVQRVYCAKTKRELVKEEGLHCSRELETFTFVKSEIESGESVMRKKLQAAMDEEANNGDSGFASLMLGSRRRTAKISNIAKAAKVRSGAGINDANEADDSDDDFAQSTSSAKTKKRKSNKKDKKGLSGDESGRSKSKSSSKAKAKAQKQREDADDAQSDSEFEDEVKPKTKAKTKTKAKVVRSTTTTPRRSPRRSPRLGSPTRAMGSDADGDDEIQFGEYGADVLHCATNLLKTSF